MLAAESVSVPPPLSVRPPVLSAAVSTVIPLTFVAPAMKNPRGRRWSACRRWWTTDAVDLAGRVELGVAGGGGSAAAAAGERYGQAGS